MPQNTQIQVRRGAASAWSTQTLAAGEIGLETDTGKFKIGDGTTVWSSLAYSPVGVTYSSGTNAVVNRATNLASSGIGLPYQSAANTTTIITTASGDNGKSVVIASGVPSLSKLAITSTYFTTGSTSSADLAGILTDETGTGVVVYNNTPTLITPAIQSGGATFAGSSSGTTTLKAGAIASGTLTLPASTGTLLTQETAASTYFPLAGGTLTGGLNAGSNSISSVSELTASTITANTVNITGPTTLSALNTAGFVKTNSSGGLLVSQTVTLTSGSNQVTGILPYGNGGTGQSSFTNGHFVKAGASAFTGQSGILSTDIIDAQQKLMASGYLWNGGGSVSDPSKIRIWVTPTQPTSGMVAGDLWFY